MKEKVSAIIEALKNAGATIDGKAKEENKDLIKRIDLYNDGFSGGENSVHKRKRLLLELNLPENMSLNMLLKVINLLITKEEYKKILEKIEK